MSSPTQAPRRGRRVKFPDPSDCRHNQTSVLCSPDRVMALYNQDHPGATRRRMTDSVKNWFDDKAQRHGWAFVQWFKDAATEHGAGCVLSTISVQFRPLPPLPGSS